MMQSDNDEYARWAKRIFGVLLVLILLFLALKTCGLFRRNIGQISGAYREVEQWGP